MIAPCIGGPYDGMKLDHNDLNLYATFQPVGIRRFFIMPDGGEWDAVRLGEKNPKTDDVFHGQGSIYELVRTSSGAELRYDPDESAFRAARLEFADSRQPVAVDTTKWEYYQCHRGEERAPFPEGYFTVTDEKDREWRCYAVTQEQQEAFGGPMYASQMMSLSVRNKAELVAALSDALD